MIGSGAGAEANFEEAEQSQGPAHHSTNLTHLLIPFTQDHPTFLALVPSYPNCLLDVLGHKALLNTNIIDMFWGSIKHKEWSVSCLTAALLLFWHWSNNFL